MPLVVPCVQATEESAREKADKDGEGYDRLPAILFGVPSHHPEHNRGGTIAEVACRHCIVKLPRTECTKAGVLQRRTERDQRNYPLTGKVCAEQGQNEQNRTFQTLTDQRRAKGVLLGLHSKQPGYRRAQEEGSNGRKKVHGVCPVVVRGIHPKLNDVPRLGGGEDMVVREVRVSIQRTASQSEQAANYKQAGHRSNRGYAAFGGLLVETPAARHTAELQGRIGLRVFLNLWTSQTPATNGKDQSRARARSVQDPTQDPTPSSNAWETPPEIPRMSVAQRHSRGALPA